MGLVIQEAADHAAQHGSKDREAGDAGKGVAAVAAGASRVVQLSIGGRTPIDEAAAAVVAHAASQRMIGSRVLSPIAVSQTGIGQLDLSAIEVVCLSYFASNPQTYARFVCRRLKRRAPQVKILVCRWNAADGGATSEQPGNLEASHVGADAVAHSLDECLGILEAWGLGAPSPPMVAAPIPEDEVVRLAALRALGLASGQGRHFDKIAARVASAFGTAMAFVTVIDETNQHWPGAVGLPARLDACRMAPRDTSICGHVVAANDALVIQDVAKDVRFASNPFLIENGIRAYAGVPLRTRSGYAIGALCAIDTRPRAFKDDDVRVLRNIADELMHTIEARAQVRDPQRREPESATDDGNSTAVSAPRT